MMSQRRGVLLGLAVAGLAGLGMVACSGDRNASDERSGQATKSARRISADAEVASAFALLSAQATLSNVDRVVVAQQAYRLQKAMGLVVLEPVSEEEAAAAESLVNLGQAVAALTYRAAHQADFERMFNQLITDGGAFVAEYLPSTTD